MEGKESLPTRVINATRLVIDKLLPRQLKHTDLNPNEGKLRSAGASEDHPMFKSPDTPPIHDDTI